MSSKSVSGILVGLGLLVILVAGSVPSWSDADRVVHDRAGAHDVIQIGEGLIFLGAVLRLRDKGWPIPMGMLALSMFYDLLYPDARQFFLITPSEGWWSVQRHCAERCLVASLPVVILVIALLEGEEDDAR